VQIDFASIAFRILNVFLAVAAGVYIAEKMITRLPRAGGRILGVPTPLFAISAVDARAAHAYLAQLLSSGSITMTHVYVYTLLTWPLRTLLLQLRVGALPLALTSLGPLLGLAYTMLVMGPSTIAFIVGLVMARRVEWPDVAELRSVRRGFRGALRTAASVTIRYAAFEAVFAALSRFGIKLSLAWLPLSPVAIAVASLAATRPTMGIAAAAAPLAHGLITPLEALAALFVGRLIFMTVYEMPRTYAQFYASIYPAKVAARVMALVLAVFYPTSIAIALAIVPAAAYL